MINFKKGLNKNNPFNPYKNKVRIEKFIYYIQLEGEIFKSIEELDNNFLISNYGRIIKKGYKDSINRFINHTLIKINYNTKGYYFLDNHKKIYINEYFNKYFDKNIDEFMESNYDIKRPKINYNNNCGYERKIEIIYNNKIINILNITQLSKVYNISACTIRKIIDKNIQYKGYIFKTHINNNINEKKIILKF